MTNTDEEELEKQYSPSQWSPHSKPEEVLRDYISETVRGSYIARNMIKGSFDVSYGKSNNQKIDIFGETTLPKVAPILVFVHGGYWTSGSRRDSSYCARPLFEAGVLSMIMGYDLVSDTFTLPEVVTQIQCGIKFVLEFALKRGTSGVFFYGHSTGAHLISMALSSDPPELELYKLIKGLVLVSGIYDLNPILKTSYAKSAHITNDIAGFCSPLKVIPTLKNNIDTAIRILLPVAQHDSPLFIKQSHDYSEELINHGFQNVEYMDVMGMDHFTIVQNLYDRDHSVTLKLIEFVKSGSQQIIDSITKSEDEKAADDSMKSGDQPSTDSVKKADGDEPTDDPMKSGALTSTGSPVKSEEEQSCEKEAGKSADQQSTDSPVKSEDEQSTDIPAKSGDQQSTDSTVKSEDEQSTDDPEKHGDQQSMGSPVKSENEQSTDDPTKSGDQQSTGSTVKSDDEQSTDDLMKSGDQQSTGSPVKSEDERSTDDPMKSGDQQSTGSPVKSEDQQSTGSPVKSEDERSTDDPMKSGDQQSTSSTVKSEDERSTDDPMKSGDQQSTGSPVKSEDEQSTDDQDQIDHPVKSEDEQSTGHIIRSDEESSDRLIKSTDEESNDQPMKSGDELSTEDQSIEYEDQESPNQPMKDESQQSPNKEESAFKINKET